MPTSRFISLTLLLILNISIAFAQKQIVTGIVSDSKTGQPIPHAEIFISGTTSGCITDSLGSFQLAIPFSPCVLVADHVSYESIIQPIQKGENLKIVLDPTNIKLQEVSVSGKSKRKINLRYFYAHFLGDSPNNVNILNDSVLIFQSDRMEFTARSNEPLVVENEYLGYRIKVILEEFKVISRDGPDGKQLPLNSAGGGEITQLKGYYFYEPLENGNPGKAALYNSNRRQTYYGSYRHFLKSIYDDDTDAQGYKLEAPFYRVMNTSPDQQLKEYVIMANKLVVSYYSDEERFPIPVSKVNDADYYKEEQSVIYPTKDAFIIRKNGTSPNLKFVTEGYMDMKNFANSLPEDYVPPVK